MLSRRAHRLVPTLALTSLLSCASTPDGREPSSSASTALSEAPPLVAAPVRRANVDDLATLVPKEADAAVYVPRAALELAAALAPAELLGELGPLLAAKDDVEDALVFHESAPNTRSSGPFSSGVWGAAVRLRSPDALDRFAAALGAEPNGDDRWSAKRVELSALRADGLVLVAQNRRVLDRMLVLREEAANVTASESFIGAALHRLGPEKAKRQSPGSFWAVMDLSNLPQGASTTSAGSFGFATFDPTHGLELRVAVNGSDVIQASRLVAPLDPALALELPQPTARPAIGVWSMSLARPEKVGLRDWIVAADASLESFITAMIEPTTSLAELDRVLGDEVAIGVYPSSRAPTSFEEAITSSAVVVMARINDAATVKRLLEAVAKGAGKDTKIVGGVVTTTSKSGVLSASVEGSNLVLRLGQKKDVDALATEKGRFADTEDGRALAVHAKASHQALFVDFAAAMRALPASLSPSAVPSDTKAFFALTYTPSERGLDVTLKGVGSTGLAAGFGVLAAVATNAARQYLLRAKVSEAKNTLGAIGRGAVQAFERESAESLTVVHKPCLSAFPVPAQVPKGTSYTPSSATGADYDAGDATRGWRCLKFAMFGPQRYQYDYRQGGGYKGPARGGPNPGRDGFEASAEGDLDGDGKTSLFTLVGRLDPKRGTMVLSDIFVSDELE